MVFTAVLVVAVLALLATQVVRLEVLALGVLAVLGISGLLPVSGLLSGFSNPATITVAAMLLLSAGLERVGVVDWVSAVLGRRAGGSSTSLLVLLALPVAGFSAFMNNTPIVALMIPITLALARRTGVAPSRLLLPISYISILGGTCTLIGTSTNILVDSLYREAGGPGFGMFDFAPLGLLFLAAGGGLVLFLAGRLLPERTSLSLALDSRAPGHFVTEVVLPPGSALGGRRLGEVFREKDELQVLELIRDEVPIMGPSLETMLEAGDTLLIEGTARTIHQVLERRGLERGTAIADAERVAISRVDLRVVEVVIAPNSSFRDRRLQDLGLHRRFGVQVLGVRRLGRHHQYNIRVLRLRAGDVLLVQGEPAALRNLQEEGDVILIEGVEGSLTFPSKAPLALLILAGVVGGAAAGLAPVVLLALLGVLAMLATGCLDLPRAWRNLDAGVLLLLVAMIPLGLAMEASGLASWVAEQVVAATRNLGPMALVSAFYLLASIFSAVLSNNATAVLFTPVALDAAAGLDVDPRPLLIAVTFGASASFVTPIGYQTNTLVMGPGGYLLRDYLRLGLPLSLLLWLVASLCIPLFWPLGGG